MAFLLSMTNSLLDSFEEVEITGICLLLDLVIFPALEDFVSKVFIS